MQVLNDLHVYQVLKPATCADVACTAPTDHNVGPGIKARMTVLYEEWVGWERAGEPKVSASERRLLLARWVSVASLQANTESLIRQSFMETGFLLARDDSENHLIKMGGVEDYTVPFLDSNKTLFHREAG